MISPIRTMPPIDVKHLTEMLPRAKSFRAAIAIEFPLSFQS